MKRIDLTGRVFGELTVLGFSHSHVQPSGQKRAVWNVLCSCGRRKQVNSANLTGGGTVSCGCVGAENRRKSRAKPDGVAAMNSLILSYKNSAKARGIPFLLDSETFYKYVIKPCVYCGSVSQSEHKGKYRTGFKYTGIDRINSDVGYQDGNIAPCCSMCNMMKNKHNVDIFLQHIEKIYLHSKAKRA